MRLLNIGGTAVNIDAIDYIKNETAATNLRTMGVDVKVAQELLRHANSRITMDVYTRAVSADKRSASGRQMDMLMAG